MMKVKFVLLAALFSLNACSPVYLMRAAYEQAKILSRREKIESVINRPDTEEEKKRKLILVQEAREYSKRIGLEPKDTFTKYAKIDSDVLSWVVLASKPDAFHLYTWWFPIVGSVPYKGFFDLEDAKKTALKLEEKGFEVSIRGTTAYSTLGWFNDPILSAALKNDEITLVNTVIHESVHTTFWLKDQVEFNESLANFIGTIESCNFFKIRLELCRQDDSSCREENEHYLKQCQNAKEREFALAKMMSALYADLSSLYAGSGDKAQKLLERELIFSKHVEPFLQLYPNVKSLQKINNAEIMQHKLYLSGFDELLVFFKKCEEDLVRMLAKIQENEKLLRLSKNPFSELSSL